MHTKNRAFTLVEVLVVVAVAGVISLAALSVWERFHGAWHMLAAGRDSESSVLFGAGIPEARLLRGAELLEADFTHLRFRDPDGSEHEFRHEDTLFLLDQDTLFRGGRLQGVAFELRGRVFHRDGYALPSTAEDSLDADRSGVVDFTELDRDRSGTLDAMELRYLRWWGYRFVYGRTAQAWSGGFAPRE